jgi:hypothetical protein
MAITDAPKTLLASHDDRRFVIKSDPSVGWYLLVYQGDRCTHDYLQDTLADALAQAEADFGVAKSAWKPQEP